MNRKTSLKKQNAFFLGWYSNSSGKYQRGTSFYSALSLTGEKKQNFMLVIGFMRMHHVCRNKFTILFLKHCQWDCKVIWTNKHLVHSGFDASMEHL